MWEGRAAEGEEEATVNQNISMNAIMMSRTV